MLCAMAAKDYTTLDAGGRPDGLLDLARRDEGGRLGGAPRPPTFARQPGEPRRVQPSRARQES